jgi:hypothetical protein
MQLWLIYRAAGYFGLNKSGTPSARATCPVMVMYNEQIG